jgi:hypothetical protein
MAASIFEWYGFDAKVGTEIEIAYKMGLLVLRDPLRRRRELGCPSNPTSVAVG